MNRQNISIITAVLMCLYFVAPAHAQYDRGESAADFPLPVTLLAFTASGGPNSVTLQWKTQSEVDMAGYNLYRSLGLQGPFDRINNILIPGQGSGPIQQEYQYQDEELIPGFHYYYQLAIVEVTGRENVNQQIVMGLPLGSGGTTAMPPEGAQLTDLKLIGNFPEPFNGQTAIAFQVYENSPVQLEVFNCNGTKIRTLISATLPPGDYLEVFKDDKLPSGIYFYRLTGTKGFNTVRKMVLLR
jgi:hypothetical protein